MVKIAKNILKTREITPEILKSLAKELNISVKDLLALDGKVDPFFATNSKFQIRNGKWAYHWWKELGKPKIHTRAFNYALIGKAHLPHNNEVYDGSDRHYTFLRVAISLARYQGLIPYEKVPDHKTRLHKNYNLYLSNNIHKLTNFAVDFEWIENQILEKIYAIWYPYELQDTVCEVWCEKSSIIETLEPILLSYRANYIEGEGDISLSRCWEFVDRVIKYYKFFNIKKFRVFYISDFDPVGIVMPISMARKIEYLLYKVLAKEGIPYDDIDVRVEDIVVTPEQVKKFNLIPTKIPKEKVTAKDGSSRRTAYYTRVKDFQRRFGVKGMVEIEALAMTAPNEIPRLVEERLSRYYDKEVDRWIQFEMDRVRQIIKTTLKNVDWNDLPRLGHLRIDWTPLHEYVEAVTPPRARHNESADWGIFWLFESQLDYAQQLLRYTQFKMNLKEEVIKQQYPNDGCPEPISRIEGQSLTDEEFEKFLEYVAKKQHELRSIDETESYEEG